MSPQDEIWLLPRVRQKWKCSRKFRQIFQICQKSVFLTFQEFHLQALKIFLNVLSLGLECNWTFPSESEFAKNSIKISKVKSKFGRSKHFESSLFTLGNEMKFLRRRNDCVWSRENKSSDRAQKSFLFTLFQIILLFEISAPWNFVKNQGSKLCFFTGAERSKSHCSSL